MRPSNELGPRASRRLLAGRGRGRQKYRAEATWVGEIRFDSKKEAGTYRDLLVLWNAEKLVFPPLRQVPFHLPGGVVYRVDFVIQEFDTLRVRFLDTKGFRTKEYKLKKKQVEDLYPGVKIEEL